jgi:hypothetical protein
MNIKTIMKVVTKHIPKAEGTKTENAATREIVIMKEEEAICNQIT